MIKYVLCVKEKVCESCCFIKFFAVITINSKPYLNTVVSIVTAKSTNFEVNLSYNIALSLTVKINCSN